MDIDIILEIIFNVAKENIPLKDDFNVYDKGESTLNILLVIKKDIIKHIIMDTEEYIYVIKIYFPSLIYLLFNFFIIQFNFIY